MEINELEMLREQVRIQAEKIASLMFETSRQQAIISVLTKNKESGDDG